MKVYEEYKVYGPYYRKDGRQHVVLVHTITKKKKTVSYPKFLYETHHNRYLVGDETIDHDDRDFTNNDINNLIVRNRVDHIKIDALRNKPEEFTCPECNTKFIAEGKKLQDIKWNRKRGSPGPFCGRSCAGKHNTRVQKGESTAPLTHPKMEKYYLSK